MMNQATNTQTLSAVDPNSIENLYAINVSQGQTSLYVPSTTNSEPGSCTMYSVDNHSIENDGFSNSAYNPMQHGEPSTRTIEDGSNVTSHATTSSSNAQPDYGGSYASYTNSTGTYSHGSTAYQGYYSGYQQQQQEQQPNPPPSYSQPVVGAYQNTGAPYQPISSYQNTVSYAGPTSYSSTYYNPGAYQTAGGYPSSGYAQQTTTWNGGNYANYNTNQYSNYAPDTSGAYAAGNAVGANSLHYQQQYKQWADYYNQTEVSCAPGTETLSVATSTSTQVSQVPSVGGGYTNSNSQAPITFAAPWRPESSSSQTSLLQV